MIKLDREQSVSGLFVRPRGAKACLVLAHGAGADMDHPFMAKLATGLAALGIATLRFQFPYTEQGRKRPDAPALCHTTVRAAVAKARQLAPSLPLFAGGKSFGGRMTSQAQAEAPLPRVLGLAFFGFPLHPPNRPSIDRAEHLSQLKIPMLFLQGTRDALAKIQLLKPLAKRLGQRATLVVIQNADHSFHVPVRSGQSDDDILREMAQAFDAWTQAVIENDASGLRHDGPRRMARNNRKASTKST
jgi:predicted alpha/beta-hydrolase family hydrolase